MTHKTIVKNIQNAHGFSRDLILMIKKILQSPRTTLTLDIIGIICMVCFVTMTLHHKFIVQIIPSCHFTYEMITAVNCGKGFFSVVLAYLFLFYPPMGAGVATLIGYGLILHFSFFDSLWPLLILLLIIMPVICSLRASLRIGKTLFSKKSEISEKRRKNAWIAISIIFLPAIIFAGIQTYLKPPQTSKRTIVVDMWDREMSVPRRYLDNWSLSSKKAPDKDIAKYSLSIGRKETPYVILNLPADVISTELSQQAAIKVTVAPRAVEITDGELYDARTTYLDKELSQPYFKNKDFKTKYDLYGKPETENEWLVYKSATDAVNYEPDIHVYKDKAGNILNIIECMPIRWCKKSRPGQEGFSYDKCDDDSCHECEKQCRDASMGTAEYKISYSFDKSKIDEYLLLHEGIVRFIEEHSRKKKE